tara:strand:+ start:40913 stop:41473 length:561 start_codon:yes stop_codon:yes gene_type:complete
MTVKINHDRYVCFDDNGNIDRIARTPDPNLENLLVDFEQVRQFAEGTQSLRNFKVEYDFLEKKYILKNIQEYYESHDTYNFIYEIPKTQSDDTEIIIKQNFKENCWELVLGKKFKNYIESQNISIDPTRQVYSVTKLYDPNVLYKTLTFKNNLKISFDSKFEFDKTNVSLYTVRKFSSYYHEVVNA